MGSNLMNAVFNKNKDEIEKQIRLLEENVNWSLITFIDEFVPYLIGETNLKYNNFHMIKMSLFVKQLSMDKLLAKETEIKMLRLLACEMVRRHFFKIEIAKNDNCNKEATFYLHNFQKEMKNKNAHNAFHYAFGLQKTKPNLLANLLLKLGAVFIPQTLGHSLSCYYPAVKQMVNSFNKHSHTALMSYIIYLTRFDINDFLIKKIHDDNRSSIDYLKILKICSTGKGIVNLHHMITFFILAEWETASFNEEKKVPYSILKNWIKDKKLEDGIDNKLENYSKSDYQIVSYEEFKELFEFENREQTLNLVFSQLKKDSITTIDWLFRIYASSYDERTWDPHYLTSLYASFKLYRQKDKFGENACLMALYQAITYFLDSVKI